MRQSSHRASLWLPSILTLIFPALSAAAFGDDIWFDIDPRQSPKVDINAEIAEKINAKARQARVLRADMNRLGTILRGDEAVKTVTVPLPDGTTVEYRLVDAPVMAEQLRLEYPSIKTLRGHEVGNPANSGRFDMTPHGFHAMIRHNEETVFIDPQFKDSDQRYISYYKKNAEPLAERQSESVLLEKALLENEKSENERSEKELPDTTLSDNTVLGDVPNNVPDNVPDNGSARLTHAKYGGGNILRTYRIAVSATGEYTQVHGGTREDGLAAIVTMLNRVNDIFERDLAIRLELVDGNDAVIFTDADTDPFANTDADLETNIDVQAVNIGIGNFDIGHIVNTGGGGVAALGSVCDDNRKSAGLTGSPRPTGDAFYIDYVAHEIGHQFGAAHTFNGTTLACGGGNRSPSSAFEPGSASTIMGYAGICGEENLQNHSDAYFHARSIEQVFAHLKSGPGAQCGTTSTLDNNRPAAEAGRNYTIPARTPFKLSATASDQDGDPLTYTWEQYDLGAASSDRATLIDDGSRPIFRSWSPTLSGERYLPRLENVLKNSLALGETYPTTTRELNFRLTVRDGKGGVDCDEMKIDVRADAGPFSVVEPATGVRWTGGERHRIVWEVAETDQSPIDCGSVRIDLSTDGGLSFTDVLSDETANDGEHIVTTTEVTTSRARIRVSCRNNIFYAVNAGDFSIDSNIDDTVPRIEDQQEIVFVEDSRREIQLNDLIVADRDGQYPDGFTLTVNSGEHYEVENNIVTPAENFAGSLKVPVFVSKDTSDGWLVSSLFDLDVVVTPVNDPPMALADTVAVAAGSSENRIDVLLNDGDVDTGDLLTLVSVDYSGSGRVAIEGDELIYTPAAGFSGPDSLAYTVADREGETATASVDITVSAPSGSGSGGGGAFSLWGELLLATGLMLKYLRNVRKTI